MKQIVIVYYSKSGNTRLVADYFKNRLSIQLADHEKKADITLFNAQNVHELNLSLIQNADALIFGSPDYFGYPSGYIKVVIDEIYPIRNKLSDKPAVGFVTHGGGGKAVDSLKNLLKWSKFQLQGSIISIRNSTIDEVIEGEISHACDLLINFL